MKKLVGYGRLPIRFNEAETIVSMVTFKDTVFVATTKRVFRLVGEQLQAVEFMLAPEEDQHDEK